MVPALLAGESIARCFGHNAILCALPIELHPLARSNALMQLPVDTYFVRFRVKRKNDIDTDIDPVARRWVTRPSRKTLSLGGRGCAIQVFHRLHRVHSVRTANSEQQAPFGLAIKAKAERAWKPLPHPGGVNMRVRGRQLVTTAFLAPWPF